MTYQRPVRKAIKITGSGETFRYFPLTANDQDFRRAVPWYLAAAVVVSTIAALSVCLIRGRWSPLEPVLVLSNCTGVSIASLLCLARLTFMRRLQTVRGWRNALYLALVAIGTLIGNELGHLFVGRSLHGSNPLLSDDAIIAVKYALIGAIVAVTIGSGLDERARRKRDLERAERIAIEAQLRALQAQIEPHFLFNSLANLDALIATDAPRARHLLANLIRYLRAALTHARSETATLQTEVELLKAYLAIMALRLHNRLTTEFNCDPECMRLAFPAMLLQPLIENAITHGIEPAEDGGTISVSVRRSADLLVIAVDDTGVGLGNAQTAGTGAGIQNIRARLKSLFGDSARLTLEARTPHGTHAGIEVPLRLLSHGAS